MPPKKAAAKGKKRARTPEPDPTREVVDVDAAGETQTQGPNKRVKTSSPKENSEPLEGTTEKSSDSVNEVASVVPKPTASNAIDRTADPEIKFTGKFDLYGMKLPFLHKVYLPPGSKTPNHEELYKTILTYQAKKDNTAQITLPDELTTGASGTFRSFVLCDPMEELPFPIKITGINKTEVKFTSSQMAESVHISKTVQGRGVAGDLELDENNCGVSSASGEIKMRPLWSKLYAEGKNMELFEGFFSFDVSYSGMYRRKGHGSGRNVEMAFWAVRGVV